jgi:RAP domain
VAVIRLTQLACLLRAVVRVLETSMGLRVEEEQVVGGEMSVDALIMPPRVGGRGLAPIAVEVDGPTHFFNNHTREPTGTTVFKRRLLDLAVRRGELRGWVSVPYWEWRAREGDASRQQLLREIFKAKSLGVDMCR